MNKTVFMGLGAAVVVVIGLLLGTRLFGSPTNVGGAGNPTPTPQASATGTATPSAPPGGSVAYEGDEGFATTYVGLDPDDIGVSGTAVTTSRGGVHTVRLECFARDGDTWALGGTLERSTYAGERAGAWSAVLVRDGSPQRIAIWLSDDKAEGSDCEGWLASIDLPNLDPENEEFFLPVESGTLVPPPDPAS